MNSFGRAVLLGIVTSFSLFAARAVEQKSDVAPTQEKGTLSAPQILERYQKAIGGKEAFNKHSSQHVLGTISITAQRLNGEMEVFAARPNKLVMKVTMPGLGDVTTGYNGEVGWMSSAVTGPTLLEGIMVEEIATQADFNHSLHDASDFKVMELQGKEQFNNEECYKLKLVHRGGFESTEFFSVKSGLQVGFIATEHTPVGPVKATTIVTDYQQFGDLYMPSKTIQKASGIETVITIKEMEYDNVNAAVFEVPAEVKTLIEQKKKNAAAQSEVKKGN